MLEEIQHLRCKTDASPTRLKCREARFRTVPVKGVEVRVLSSALSSVRTYVELMQALFVWGAKPGTRRDINSLHCAAHTHKSYSQRESLLGEGGKAGCVETLGR